VTINLAKDEELLELLADANFGIVGIGIESPNKESLEETNKLQNLRGDLVADCKKIMSYGISIGAAMIVGFDHDTSEIFDQQFDFLQEAYIPSVRINLLKAPQGTRLWRRLLKEERLLDVSSGLYDEKDFFGRDSRGATNIIPRNMTRAELLSGYVKLAEKVYEWDNFAERIKNFVSNVKRQPNVAQRDESEGDLPPDVSSFLFSLDEKVRNIIFDIVLHTRQKAPFMMRKVIGLISRQYLEASNLPLLRAAITKQIEFEESVDMEQFAAREKVLIPEGFEEPYKEIFPEIHQRIYSGLIDKTHTNKALVEVLTDFLTRWGQAWDDLSEQHRVFLYELADRAIAKENRFAGTRSSIPGTEALLDMKNVYLSEEILKAVEKELRH
jgi:hypothetical protein